METLKFLLLLPLIVWVTISTLFFCVAYCIMSLRYRTRWFSMFKAVDQTLAFQERLLTALRLLCLYISRKLRIRNRTYMKTVTIYTDGACSGTNVEKDLFSISHILYAIPGLDPDKVKAFILAQPDDRMLSQFLSEHDLQIPLIDAVRTILSKNKFLVGPVKDVIRVLRIFKTCYFSKNGSVYESPEFVYCHCISMILLNSNLHDPQVPHRKTLSEYVMQCRRVLTPKIINACDPFRVYESINETPLDTSFFVPEDFASTIDGYAKRRKVGLITFFESWKQEYYRLHNYSLFCYKQKPDIETGNPKGVVQLNKVKISCDFEGGNVRLKLESQKELNIVRYKEGRPYFKRGVDVMVLEFQDKKQRDSWFQPLREASMMSDFLDEPPPGMVLAFQRV